MTLAALVLFVSAAQVPLSPGPAVTTLVAARVDDAGVPKVLLSWTPHPQTLFQGMITDDGGSNVEVRGHEVRVSADPITDLTWASATVVTGSIVFDDATGQAILTVPPVGWYRTYHYGVRYIALHFSLSPVSNDGAIAVAPDEDTTPPEAVTTLAGQSSSGTVVLNWIAPSDNLGTEPLTRAYDLRYSTTPITSDPEWDASSILPSPPAPAGAGSPQSMTVEGLPEGMTLYFALKSADGASNWSPLSNAAGLLVQPDPAPPAQVPGFSFRSVTYRSVALAWEAPGDDGMIGRALRYDLRISPSSMVQDADFDAAAMASDLPAPLDAGLLQELVIDHLVPDHRYVFAIQAEDERGKWGARAQVEAVTPKPPGSAGASSPCTQSAGLALGGAGLLLFLAGSLVRRR